MLIIFFFVCELALAARIVQVHEIAAQSITQQKTISLKLGGLSTKNLRPTVRTA